MIKPILLAVFMAISLLAIITDAKFTAKFFNHCSEPISYEFTADKGRNCGLKSLAAGAVIDGPADCEPVACGTNAALDTKCGGSTLLLHKNGKTLAAEYGNRVDSKGVRVMWYNWSNDDGNPFLDKKRQFHAGANCPDIDCPAGTDDCDYKNQNPQFESCSPDPFYIEIHVC